MVNHISIGEAIDACIEQKGRKIAVNDHCYAVMLMGVDCKRSTWTVRPYSTMHSMVLACGMDDRKTTDVSRKHLVFYLLSNRSGISMEY